MKRETLFAIAAGAALLTIAWVINGPLTDAKLRRIVREETRALTRLPAAGEKTFVFADAQGTRHTLKEFTGTPLVMNLWATWCPPCVEEMPRLATLQERYAGRLRVIAISTDTGGFADIDTFLAAHPIAHPPFYHDTDGVLMRQLKLRGLPTTFILNAQGQTVAKLERRIKENDKEFLEILDGMTNPALTERPAPTISNPVGRQFR